MFRGIYFLAAAMMLSVLGQAQSNIISNNKSLAFLNSAMQNADYNKVYLSSSMLPNPLSDESDFTSYLFHGEAKLSDQFRIGIHRSTVDSRLYKLDMNKLYGSFKFEFEEGSFISFGLEAGLYSDQIRTEEFNKVFAPTVHSFTDSIATDLDFGFGVVYENRGLSIGLSLNKLNSPAFVPFPFQRWAFGTGADTSFVVKKDTVVLWGEEDFVNYDVQTHINILYRWEASKNIDLLHSLHISNPSLDGVEYFSFQNFMEFKEKLTLGVGVYYNGETSYMASLGFAFTDNIRLEVASFLHEEFNYDPDADFPFAFLGRNRDPVKAKGSYVSAGYVPSFEANLQLRF